MYHIINKNKQYILAHIKFKESPPILSLFFLLLSARYLKKKTSYSVVICACRRQSNTYFIIILFGVILVFLCLRYVHKAMSRHAERLISPHVFLNKCLIMPLVIVSMTAIAPAAQTEHINFGNRPSCGQH